MLCLPMREVETFFHLTSGGITFMQLKLPADFPKIWCRFCVSFLAFSWTLGLSAGVYFAGTMQSSVFSLMRAAASSRVSIVGLIVLLIFPLLLSAFAVYLSAPICLLPVSFCRGAAFGFCSLGALYAFGSAGWLVRLMLLFSASAMTVPLFWFWIRHISGNKLLLRRDLAVCSALAVVIGIIDYFLVSPYLVMLMNYS